MNTHKTLIHGRCPLNGCWDYYEVWFQTEEFVDVAEIEHTCDSIRGNTKTQEQMADFLKERFSACRITVTGRHTSNTHTECVR